LTSFYHYDGQLSTRQLSDASQNVTDTYTYDAFGLLLNRSGSTENNYLYSGEQYDPNCGFYYLRARYYNASVGRFITMDTYPGMQFEPASLHKYLYCESGPVGRWDPSGKLGIIGSALVEVTTELFLRTILTSVVTVTFGHLISIAYTPAEWSGNYTVLTSQWGNPYWGFGFIVISLSGIHESEKGIDYGYGLYFILMSGYTIGDPLNVSFSLKIGFLTPGIFKANPLTLVGPVIFISGSWTWPVWAGGGGIGFGISATVMTMGMGFTPKGFTGPILGKDRGIDFMAGLSLPLYLNY
jgi:RHS repeat-associated protein